MAADGSIRIDTKLDSSKLPGQIAQIKKNIGEGLKDAGAIATRALIGVTAAIGGIAVASKKFADTTGRIDDMSQSLGVSKKAFQELDYIFKLNGASLDSFGIGMKTLQETTQKAAGGAETALSKLGVSVRNASGDMKSQEQILRESIAAFNALPQGVDKSTLATDLFGRSALELMPLLNQEAGSIDALIGRAHELGIIMSDDAVNAGAEFGDTLDNLSIVGNSFLNEVVAPMVPMITDAIQQFISWATEGDRLKNTITAAVTAISGAWNSGIIPALIATAAAIKGASIAMAAFNAVMSANPVSLIIIGLAAFVSAIILIYKNWDKLVSFFEITIARLVSQFKIMGSVIGEAFTIGFNSAKIAALSLVNIIAQNVLGAVKSMLDVMGKLPFVGDLFKGASAAVGGFADGIDAATDAAKNESAQAIAAAKASQDAFEKAERAKIAAINERSKANQKAADSMTSGVLAPSPAGGSVSAGTDTKSIELEKMKIELLQQEAVIRAKVKDGILDEDTARKQSIALLEQNIDAMYQLGYTADETGSTGGAMLADYKKKLDALKKTTKQAAAAGLGKELGESIPKNIARGVNNNLRIAIDAVKSTVSNIGSAIVATGNIISGAFSFISALAKFDPKVMYNSFKELIDGLKDFFTNDIGALPIYFEMGVKILADFLSGIFSQLPKIMETMSNAILSMVDIIKTNAPMIMDQGSAIFFGFLNAILSVLPTVIETIGNLIISMASKIGENAPKVIGQIIIIMFELLKSILNALPSILDAALKIVIELIKGLAQGMPDLLAQIVTTLVGLVQTIIDNLPMLISAGVQLILALIQGLIKSKHQLISALCEMFPALVTAIIQALPDLVYAFIMLIPLLAAAIVQDRLMLIEIGFAIVKAVILGIIELIKQIPAIGVALVTGFIDGIIQAGKNIWQSIRSIFDAVINSIKALFGIHSPSTLFSGFGANLIQGFINGITSMGPKLLESVKNVVGGVAKAAAGVASTVGGAVSGVVSTIGTAAIGAATTVGNAAAGVGQAAAGVAAGVGSAIGGALGKLKFWATGTLDHPGGAAVINENGPELVTLPGGSKVMTAAATSNIFNSGLASIMAGLNKSALSPSMPPTNSGMVTLVNKVTVKAEIDGREVGRAAYENLDRFALI